MNTFKQNKLAEKLSLGKGKDFWRGVRKIKGDTKISTTAINGVSGGSNIENVWKLHYEKLFNCFDQNNFFTESIQLSLTVQLCRMCYGELKPAPFSA